MDHDATRHSPRNFPTIAETFGLSPPRERLRQALVALRGADGVPPSRFDRTSLALLDPRLSLPLWRGRFAVPRRAVLTTLFNHRQTPIAQGWSVRRTQIEDFRGRGLTYDSHNGTDFAIPVGTLVVAPAAGVVARVWSEFNRGGLKVAIDHGDGLMTSSAHLARALVSEGDRVAAGSPIAVSGYSGLDGFATFPWGVPHVHFNCWLGGEPVDPFARPGEASLWHGGQPIPWRGERPAREEREEFDAARVDAVIASCREPATRRRLASIEPGARRARHLVAERNYYPTRFADRGPVYRLPSTRQERLWLPFAAHDLDGVVFRDELGW